MNNSNISWHATKINKNGREEIKKHKGACIWFTGLSGSGKSTLANELEYQLNLKNIHTYLLDGDNIRHGLNKNLDFSEEGRKENIRRVGEVAKFFVDAGIIVITAFISPFKDDREQVRNLLEKDEFIEVYVECNLQTCEKRDPKGLYKKARLGEIKDFTGISSPYEVPLFPELKLENESDSDFLINVEKIIEYLHLKKLISF